MTDPTPVISVIIVVYNAKTTIAACIEAILNQSIDLPYEILIIDGMSDDGTRNIVQSYENQKVPLRLIDNRDRHVCSGRNIGWKNSHAQWIAYTDSDCIVPRDWLQHLYSSMIHYTSTSSDIAAVGGGNAPPDTCTFYRLLKMMFQSPLGNRQSAQTELFSKDKKVQHIPTCNILYNKDFIRSVNGFDETNFPIAGEDEDLNCRITRNGYSIIFVADCTVQHYQNNTFLSWARRMFVYGHSRFTLMNTHSELRLLKNYLVLLLPLSLFGLFLIPLTIYAIIPIALYTGSLFLNSLLLTIKCKHITLLPQLIYLFFITHFFYAAGLINGFRNQLFSKNNKT